jgi:hypothetical protein
MTCFSSIQAMNRGCKRQRVQYITTADELHRHLPDSLRNVVDDYVYSYHEHRQKMRDVFTDLRRFCNNVDEVVEVLFHIYASRVVQKIKDGQLQDGVGNWKLQEYIQLALPMTSLTEYFENGDDLLLMRKCTNEYFTFCERCDKYYLRGKSVTWYTDSLIDPLTSNSIHCSSACADCRDQLASDGCVFPSVDFIA